MYFWSSRMPSIFGNIKQHETFLIFSYFKTLLFLDLSYILMLFLWMIIFSCFNIINISPLIFLLACLCSTFCHITKGIFDNIFNLLIQSASLIYFAYIFISNKRNKSLKNINIFLIELEQISHSSTKAPSLGFYLRPFSSSS